MFAATVEFAGAARSQSASLGFEPARVFTPHPIQDRTDDEIREIARNAYRELVAALTG